MQPTSLLLFALVLASPALTATTCSHDNCYRALAHYQSTAASSFCSQFLATSSKGVPGSIATCGPTRISSACSCLTAKPTPTSTFNTSTCSRSSIAACPTAYTPCCRYICGEAQVPFDVCSPNDTTGQYASCSPCPSPAVSPVITAAP